jgi:triphosphoribosyl-dephospho-CoA synthase
MLHEVAATPKPGLVDRNNCGAHKEMDIFTFCSSVSVLQPYFVQMAYEGIRFKGNDDSDLLKNIRPIGIEAEKRMFQVTKGVNTHKGLIFSLGILISAAAYIYSRKGKVSAEEICKVSSSMCRDIVKKELKDSNRTTTKGEKLFKKTGVTGIRGEAEAGFPSVINKSLPFLKQSKGDWNLRLVNTLLHLMTIVEDSNILGRHNRETLDLVQNQTREVLLKGGPSNHRGMEILNQMDLNFIDKNISPGGSADLLAVTIFLYKIEMIPDFLH